MGHWGKMPGMVLRLSLILAHLKWSASAKKEPPTHITLVDVKAAIELVDTYFKLMALRVFGDAALPTVERKATALARYIVGKQPTIINIREIARQAGIAGLREASDVKTAVEELVEAGWLRKTSHNTPGRPPKSYEVNPAVYPQKGA